MKHKHYLLWLIILAGISLASCSESSFLDETQTTDLTTEVIFSDSTYTAGFLLEIYREIGFDTDPGRFSNIWVRFGGLQTACDEAEFKASSSITTDMLFATGSINPVVVSEDAWEKCYQNIRRVNVFLANVDGSPIADAKKKAFKAEARFLRAWYYFILLRHYGGVPLIGDVVYEAEDDIKTARNTFAECVDYILSECDAAAVDLVVRPSGRDYGRVGSGACKGLKSRLLLYAASPLFNGEAEVPDGYPVELVAYPDKNSDRWRIAMEAAKAVMDLGVYALYAGNHHEGEANYKGCNGYFWVFQASDPPTELGAQKELLVELQQPKDIYREKLFNPPSCGGDGGGFAYQGLVDAFPMLNGKSIWEEGSGYNDQNPYANRDPRLYLTICYDQHPMMNAGTVRPVDIYLNEDGTPHTQDGVYSGTPTGYYICKMQHWPAAAGNYFVGPPESRPQLRYAEILLNYAEAANEYAGPSSAVYDALKLIRARAEILPGSDNLYGLKADMTKDEMREAIRNERRIELSYEGVRFFDVRRWKIAPQTDGAVMTGMEIRLKDSKKVYKQFDVRQHVWRPAMYFWPIPYKEVVKTDNLMQNPFY
ncbi:membrane protein [Bacteroidia bacterium]|nr:membrane protein [Bacteroidia bacterium]